MPGDLETHKLDKNLSVTESHESSGPGLILSRKDLSSQTPYGKKRTRHSPGKGPWVLSLSHPPDFPFTPSAEVFSVLQLLPIKVNSAFPGAHLRYFCNGAIAR